MTEQRKNILLFLTDDHGAWANGCYGNSEVETPTLDRLASEGTRFENAFTLTPVCSPSRACLLTGRTASQVGIHDWLQDAHESIRERDWLGDVPTLFQILHDAGYFTGLSGKWHIGQPHLPPKGADDHFGLARWQGEHNGAYTYIRNGEMVTLDGNKSARITDHTLEFLENAPADQPFFLNVGYIATHSPYHKDAHQPELTALYENATFRDIPPYQAHPWVKNEGFPFENPSEQDLRDHYIGYYAAVTEIDRNVARILDALEQSGRLEDTIVIYTSDHGCTLGHHGFWGKGNSTRPLNMHEHSLRIPLIWRGPGIVPGQALNACVDHYDSFQTLLELAGVSVDPQSPGVSYRAMLGGLGQDWDDTVIGEYGDLRMIRTPEWKLVHRHPNGPHDLFHLADDPEETVNVYDHPTNQSVVADLREQLERFYLHYERAETSGLRVKELPKHNDYEAWRDGIREGRGLQVY